MDTSPQRPNAERAIPSKRRLPGACANLPSPRSRTVCTPHRHPTGRRLEGRRNIPFLCRLFERVPSPTHSPRSTPAIERTIATRRRNVIKSGHAAATQGFMQFSLSRASGMTSSTASSTPSDGTDRTPSRYAYLQVGGGERGGGAGGGRLRGHACSIGHTGRGADGKGAAHGRANSAGDVGSRWYTILPMMNLELAKGLEVQFSCGGGEGVAAQGGTRLRGVRSAWGEARQVGRQGGTCQMR